MGKKFCCKLCEAPPSYIVGDRPLYETNESYVNLETLGRRKTASKPDYYGAAHQILRTKADIDRETNHMVSYTFRVLANCVPNTRGKRFNRLDTLKKAVQYIKELSESLDDTDPIKLRDESEQTNSETPTSAALSGYVPAIQTFQNQLVTQKYPSSTIPIPNQPDYAWNASAINNRFYSSSPGSTCSSPSSDSSSSSSPEYKLIPPYTPKVQPYYHNQYETPQYLHKSSNMYDKRFLAERRPALTELHKHNFYGRSNVTTRYPRTLPRI